MFSISQPSSIYGVKEVVHEVPKHREGAHDMDINACCVCEEATTNETTTLFLFCFP